MSEPTPYDAAKHLETCETSLSRCETAAHIDRVWNWAMFKISREYATPGECAADNTKVLNMVTKRQRELGIEHQATHEDEGE